MFSRLLLLGIALLNCRLSYQLNDIYYYPTYNVWYSSSNGYENDERRKSYITFPEISDTAKNTATDKFFWRMVPEEDEILHGYYGSTARPKKTLHRMGETKQMMWIEFQADNDWNCNYGIAYTTLQVTNAHHLKFVEYLIPDTGATEPENGQDVNGEDRPYFPYLQMNVEFTTNLWGGERIVTVLALPSSQQTHTFCKRERHYYFCGWASYLQSSWQPGTPLMEFRHSTSIDPSWSLVSLNIGGAGYGKDWRGFSNALPVKVGPSSATSLGLKIKIQGSETVSRFDVYCMYSLEQDCLEDYAQERYHSFPPDQDIQRCHGFSKYTPDCKNYFEVYHEIHAGCKQLIERVGVRASQCEFNPQQNIIAVSENPATVPAVCVDVTQASVAFSDDELDVAQFTGISIKQGYTDGCVAHIMVVGGQFKRWHATTRRLEEVATEEANGDFDGQAHVSADDITRRLTDTPTRPGSKWEKMGWSDVITVTLNHPTA